MNQLKAFEQVLREQLLHLVQRGEDQRPGQIDVTGLAGSLCHAIQRPSREELEQTFEKHRLGERFLLPGAHPEDTQVRAVRKESLLNDLYALYQPIPTWCEHMQPQPDPEMGWELVFDGGTRHLGVCRELNCCPICGTKCPHA